MSKNKHVEKNPKESVLWREFNEWAGMNSVSMDHESDWRPWWECFLAGALAEHQRQQIFHGENR